MSTYFGNYNEPTAGSNWDGGGYDNQFATAFTSPANGKVTRLGAWCAGMNATPTIRLGIWNSAGTLLGVTAGVTAPSYAFALGNNARLEQDLPTPVDITSGGVYYLGFWRTASLAAQYGITSSGSHLGDVQSSPATFSGYDTLSGQIGAYAYYTTAPEVYVRRGGVWVKNTQIYVRRSGAWVQQGETAVRRSGSWHAL